VQLGQGDLMVMGGEREREAHTLVINVHAAALGMWEHHGSSSWIIIIIIISIITA